MSERMSFLDAIRADPDADAPRLIYADWLDERGESERAALVRFMVAGGEVLLTARRRRKVLGPLAANLLRRSKPLVHTLTRGLLDGFTGIDEAELDSIAPLAESETLSRYWSATPMTLSHPLVRDAAVISLGAFSAATCRALAAVPGLATREFGVFEGRGAADQAGPLKPFERLRRLSYQSPGPPGPALLRLVGAAPRLEQLTLTAETWTHAADEIRAAGVAAPGLRRLEFGHSARTVADHAALAEAFGASAPTSLAVPFARAGWGPELASFPGVGGIEKFRIGGEASDLDLRHAARLMPRLKSLEIAAAADSTAFASREAWPDLEDLTMLAAPAGLSEGDLMPHLRKLCLPTVLFHADAESYTQLLTRLCSGEPMALEALDLSGLRITPAQRQSLAGINAPLKLLTIDPPFVNLLAKQPWTPVQMNALGRAGWARDLRALNLGGPCLNKAVLAAAARHFGPRCDFYWQGDTPP